MIAVKPMNLIALINEEAMFPRVSICFIFVERSLRDLRLSL